MALSLDTFYWFKVQDGDQDGEWHIYLNGNVQPPAIHPAWPSNVGSFAVSETDSLCDSAWTEIKGLQEVYRGSPSPWPDMECRIDNNPAYHLDIASPTHMYVRPDESASGCAGTTWPV